MSKLKQSNQEVMYDTYVQIGNANAPHSLGLVRVNASCESAKAVAKLADSLFKSTSTTEHFVQPQLDDNDVERALSFFTCLWQLAIRMDIDESDEEDMEVLDAYNHQLLKPYFTEAELGNWLAVVPEGPVGEASAPFILNYPSRKVFFFPCSV